MATEAEDLRVIDKKKASQTRKRYFLWLLGLFGTLVIESYLRELGGQGLFPEIKDASEHFKQLDFPTKLTEWWYYFTKLYIPAHIDFIKTGAKNLGMLVTGDSELTEPMQYENLSNIVPLNFQDLLIDVGFAAKITAFGLTLTNFFKTIGRDVKPVFKKIKGVFTHRD